MAEHSSTFPIHDKHGHMYRLVVVEDEQWSHACLWDNRYSVGRLNIVFRSLEEWEITDIILFDEIPERVSMLHHLWLVLRGRKFQRFNYRGRGLGTALLQFVEDRARHQSVKRISGKVVQKDYAAWPELLNFYAKNGFVVIPRSDDEVFDTVARISKEVQP
jgi:GNAT superfamily N-acetyltransferase